jgi:hypothetical protein
MSSPPGQALPQREQLDLFRALPGDMAPRDSQDLMAFPFFSLAKSRRTAPIDFRSGNVTIRVEGTQEHGIATIWDADVLIWAASQIVEARDAGLRPSRWIRATPYEILRFIGRGTSLNDYQRLKAALDRLQSTTVATSIRETTGRRLHRFSWINEWKELADASGTPLGIELILPDWFYAGVLDAALVLTIDPAYFRLKGGIERWLYRLVRKHGGRQEHGWQFDFRHLYRKSGSAARFSTSPTTCAPWWRGSRARLRPRHRADAGRQHRAADLPARAARGTGITAGEPVDGLVLSGVPGIVLSGVRPSCYQEYENAGKPTTARVCVPSNLPNKKYITFSRSAPFRWTTTKRHGQEPAFQLGGPRHDLRVSQPERRRRQDHARHAHRRRTGDARPACHPAGCRPAGSSLDWTQREASRACHGCSAPWALPAKRCIRKRQNSPGGPITSSSTARRASPPWRAPRCWRPSAC